MCAQHAKHSIVVSIRGRNECVEIFTHELPDDPSTIIDMLRTELAPIDVWCKFALAYNKRKLREQSCEYLPHAQYISRKRWTQVNS